jgi:hypothetical protein
MPIINRTAHLAGRDHCLAAVMMCTARRESSVGAAAGERCSNAVSY